MNLFISMPGGMEWLLVIFFFLILLIGVPIICYRAGYRSGKREGELQALRRNQGNNA